MDWRCEGIVISARPHGETSAIVEVFTRSHGRHLGVVRGGAGRKMAATLQPGSQLRVEWRARLQDHLGLFTVEPLRGRTALLSDRRALAGLNAACALLHAALPERAEHAALWAATVPLLDAMDAGAPDWPLLFLRWEVRLLEDLGFGLDLSRCAVTGAREDLAYVSPKTGRAVSRAGAGEWAHRLLPLPEGLLGQGPMDRAALAQGFAITGHFLGRELPKGSGQPTALPDARARLVAMLTEAGG